jgi:sodium-dependent phosphate cotransporter
MDTAQGPVSTMSPYRRVPLLALFAWLFFLALDMIGTGMKSAFSSSLEAWLAQSGHEFSELSAFVAGIIGTALVQSSSSVTSMTVVLTQEGLLPLLFAIGIAHGANLGTCVTSTLVALMSETRPFRGRLIDDIRHLLFAKREEGFRRAVGAAVLHDTFNIVMVTGILLLLELPFGVVRGLAASSAESVASLLSTTVFVPNLLRVFSPATYTRPITHGLTDVGVPGLVLVALGLPLLFVALKGFAARMKSALLADVDENDLAAMGARFIGHNGRDTFVRGLLLTVLVQSSSVTTSLVVPLSAMGFFAPARLFPFILGANIGTTTTALFAASAALGTPGFLPGMTIALSHLYLNVFAVVLAVSIPGLSRAIIGSADALAEQSERVPATLLVYLVALVIVLPLIVFLLPTGAAAIALGAMLSLVIALPTLSRWRARRRRVLVSSV